MEMAKPTIGVILLLSFLFIAAHAGLESYSSCPGDNGCLSYPPAGRNQYKIVAYVQSFARGECQTVYQVASAPIACRSPTNFTAVYVADNPMRAGPNADSQPLGRLQGTAALADMRRLSPVVNYVVVFNSAPYNGTLIVAGKIGDDPNGVDELPIIGGAGDFRNAKGEAYRSVYSIDGEREIIISRWIFYFYTQE